MTAFRPGQSPPPVSMPIRIPDLRMVRDSSGYPPPRACRTVGWRAANPLRTCSMDDEASPEPSDASAADDTVEEVPAPPYDQSSDAESAEAGDHASHHESPRERRLRKLAGRKAPYRGPIVATTRGWVSRDRRWRVFAARFLDFALLTPEHLVLCSTGFFTRRPRRQVLREPLTRLIVTPLGEEPIRTLRVTGDFSHPIRLELRDDEGTAEFVRELVELTPIDPRLRAEPWAATGQLGMDPVLPPPDNAIDTEQPDEHTAQS